MTDLWSGYREAVFDVFPDLKFEFNHATWENKKGVKLTADLYSGKYFLKSRHVDIWDGKQLNIHNNIIYPKTCLLYTSPSPRDRQKSRMPSSA